MRCGEHITEAGLKGSSAKLVPPNSVLVAMYGATVGQLGYLDIAAATNQAICVLITDPEVTDPHFLYYALLQERSRLVEAAHGAAQQNLSQASVRQFSLRVPGIHEQFRIGAVLTAIDDLIDNNRRRAAVLEDIARTTYREWFLHFRYPGHEEVPLVESSLGLIPAIWQLEELGSFAALQGGRAVTKNSFVEAGYKAFSASGPDGYLPDFEVDSKGVVLSAVGARCGRTFRAAGKWSSIANTIKILPIPGRCFPAWLTLSLENPSIFPKRGSAQPFVSINDARSVRLLAPDLATMENFERVVGPIFDLIDALTLAAACLAANRDLLLPRLVTGQIDVSRVDLDALVEESVA